MNHHWSSLKRYVSTTAFPVVRQQRHWSALSLLTLTLDMKCFMIWLVSNNLFGGIPTPLKNMKVNWDDYSQYNIIWKDETCSKPPTSDVWLRPHNATWDMPIDIALISIPCLAIDYHHISWSKLAPLMETWWLIPPSGLPWQWDNGGFRRVNPLTKQKGEPSYSHIHWIWVNYNWLVVWTSLKNINQLGWLFPIYVKIKHVPNHPPDTKSLTWIVGPFLRGCFPSI